jgi:hypothetical protein
MSATALRSATTDRVPENWCRQAAHETEVDDDPPRTDRAAARSRRCRTRATGACRLTLSAGQMPASRYRSLPTPAWWPGLFTQKKTPRESFDRGKKPGLLGDGVSPLSTRPGAAEPMIIRRCGSTRGRERRRLGFFDGLDVSSVHDNLVAVVLIS